MTSMTFVVFHFDVCVVERFYNFDSSLLPRLIELLQRTGALMEELKRVSAENKKLTEMLTVVCENYNTLKGHLMTQMNKNGEKEISSSKKRKSESSNNNNIVGINGNSKSSSTDEESYKKPKKETINKATKTTRVQVKIGASESNWVVKDGYQWRKYGQKDYNGNVVGCSW